MHARPALNSVIISLGNFAKREHLKRLGLGSCEDTKPQSRKCYPWPAPDYLGLSPLWAPRQIKAYLWLSTQVTGILASVKVDVVVLAAAKMRLDWTSGSDVLSLHGFSCASARMRRRVSHDSLITAATKNQDMLEMFYEDLERTGDVMTFERPSCKSSVGRQRCRQTAESARVYRLACSTRALQTGTKTGYRWLALGVEERRCGLYFTQSCVGSEQSVKKESS